MLNFLYRRGSLPLWLPSVATAQNALHAGDTYRIAAGPGTFLNIDLAKVTLEQPHRPTPTKISENAAIDLLALTALGRSGERYTHPQHGHLTDAELEADPLMGRIRITPRNAAKVARILAARAALRTQMGL